MPPKAKPKPKKKTKPRAKVPDAPKNKGGRPRKQSELAGYEAAGGHREHMAEVMRAKSAAGREIGPPCLVRINVERIESCRLSLQSFCETYLAGWFPLAWSPDHLKAIARLEGCILRGDRYALAMMRGGGKTSLCRAAILWAILYGHRSYGVLVAATDDIAKENLLSKIKDALETNELLDCDFPYVTHPIRSLERITIRAHGQTCNGESTRIGWTDNHIVLPTVPGWHTSGAVIFSAGLTGSKLRGPSASRSDGTIMRPDVVLLDDPQTDESAVSPSQNATREKLIKGAILGMAGPKKKIAVMMACTVIAPGDLAERFLDRDRNPTWQGERSKMLYSFPSNLQIWERYFEIRKMSTLAGNSGREATEFYAEHREEMDAGAVPGWVERFEENDLSAIQTAMNIWHDNPRAFAAEHQNDPMSDDDGSSLVELNADELCAKLTKVPRRIVPRTGQRLTCGIDVQGKILFYLVAAWDESFGGSVIDYGSYPRQNRAYFTKDDAAPSLADVFPGLVETARLYKGLRILTDELMSKVWEQEGTGAQLKIERCLIDSGWNPDAVYQLCRESQFAASLTPSKGYGITAAKVPVSEWPKKDFERRGWNWILSAPERGKGRLCKIDTYLWKSFVSERLRAPQATPGCLSLFGDRPYEHQLLADHLTAEFRIITTGRGRKLEEWQQRPGRKENHWWDCLVYATVGASLQGLIWNAASAAGEPSRAQAQPKKKRRWSEIYESKHGKKA